MWYHNLKYSWYDDVWNLVCSHHQAKAELRNTFSLTYLLSSLLTPWSRVLLEKLTGSQLAKKFYGSPRFITAFTSNRHVSLSWARSIQPMPPSHFHLILSSHLCPGIPSCLFPSGFPTKPLYAPPLSPSHATYPTHLIHLDLIIRLIFGEEDRSLSSSLCSVLHSPLISFLLGPNILLSTLFSNTLNLSSSLNVSDHVSHPHKTTGKIIVLYVINFIF